MSRLNIWILGAGFSRSLGGPLLEDLFRRRTPEYWAEYHGKADAQYWQDIVAAQKVYKEGGPKGEHLWTDPEQFVDSVQSVLASADAASKNNILKVATRAANVDRAFVSRLGVAATRALLAECCLFLRATTPLASERWQPYTRWLQQLCTESAELGEGHVILTFNYDRVIEKIEKSYSWANLNYEILRDHSPSAGAVDVLKLHGSVDWLKEGGGIVRGSEEAAITALEEKMVVGAPGPLKARLVNNELSKVWKKAEDGLRVASRIYFVGYRFPESDAESRTRLLGAIRENKQDHIEVQTILGSDIRSRDSMRLKHMLETAMDNRVQRAMKVSDGLKSFEIRQRPLFAEDFMALRPGVKQED